jgi:peroxiredoxin
MQMRRIIGRHLLVLVLLVPMVASAAAPSLVLKTLDGKSENVSDFIGHGKWTVVAFWAHDCPACNADIDELAFFDAAHRHKDATVLGVSIDGWAKRKAAQRFVDLHSLDFPNLIAEPKQSVLEKFGGGEFYATPTFYVYSPQGNLEGKQIGQVTQAELEAFIKRKSQAAAATGVSPIRG